MLGQPLCFKEQLAERRMCLIRCCLVEYHLSIASDVQMFGRTATVGQRHPPKFHISIGGHGDFGESVNIAIDAMEARLIEAEITSYSSASLPVGKCAADQ